MAKIFSMNILLKGIEEPLIVQVAEKECDRLQSILNKVTLNSTFREFFCFSTLDGKMYSINLNYLQCVNYLWDASPLAPDRLRYEGPILICLSGRSESLETYAAYEEEVYDFFYYSETDDEQVFRGFTNVDGEKLSFQVDEIVYFVAPEHTYEEGARIANKE